MIGAAWGSTAQERCLDYPCNGLIGPVDQRVYRGITIQAPPSVVFRWLCQLKLAPYSYDLIDNHGRTSPQHLTPGADHLERGQRVMKIFRLADFALDEHLTIVAEPRRVRVCAAVSYVLRRQADATRLMVRVDVRYPARSSRLGCARHLPTGRLGDDAAAIAQH